MTHGGTQQLKDTRQFFEKYLIFLNIKNLLKDTRRNFHDTRQLKGTRRPFFRGFLDMTVFFFLWKDTWQLKDTQRFLGNYFIIYEF